MHRCFVGNLGQNLLSNMRVCPTEALGREHTGLYIVDRFMRIPKGASSYYIVVVASTFDNT